MTRITLNRPFLRVPAPFIPLRLFVVVSIVAAWSFALSPAQATGGLEGIANRAAILRIENEKLPGVDSMFDLGQSVFRGKAKTVPGLEICLSIYDDELIANRAAPVSKALLKEFRGKHITRVTTRLIDCSQPKSQVAQILNPKEFQSLVYYLNKRFRLRLKN